MGDVGANKQKKPLWQQSIVITRAIEDARPLQHRLEMLGAQVVVIPSLALRQCAPQGAVDAVLSLWPEVSWVVFGSRYGVHCFAQQSANAGLVLNAAVRLAAVGPATADVCKAHFPGQVLLPENFTADGLASMVQRHARPGDGVILLPGPVHGRLALRDRLQQAGYRVHRWIVYETVVANANDGPVALPNRVDYVLFASPSAVRGFLARAQLPDAATAVAIGPTTGEALRRAGITRIRQAREPTIDSLIEELS